MRTYAETMSVICAVLLVLLVLCTSCSPRQYTSDDLVEAKAESYQEGYSNGYGDGYDDGYSVGWDDSALEYRDDFSDAPTSQSSHVVWITPAGSKYHLRSCSSIRWHTVERTTIAKAEAAGYTACSKCDP